MAQWKSGLLITSKKFPCYYLRLLHTRKKISDYICKLTVTFYLSYLHSAIRTTPCRINKSIIYKTPNFFGFTNFSLKNSDTMACWSGLGSRYFVILRQHPLRNSNQQPNLPRKKKPKDLK